MTRVHRGRSNEMGCLFRVPFGWCFFLSEKYGLVEDYAKLKRTKTEQKEMTWQVAKVDRLHVVRIPYSGALLFRYRRYVDSFFFTI
jgi:hypothetical protein